MKFFLTNGHFQVDIPNFIQFTFIGIFRSELHVSIGLVSIQSSSRKLDWNFSTSTDVFVVYNSQSLIEKTLMFNILYNENIRYTIPYITPDSC